MPKGKGYKVIPTTLADSKRRKAVNEQVNRSGLKGQAGKAAKALRKASQKAKDI